MNEDIVYLNGQFVPAVDAKISVFDRGFLFGDRVYEVIPFYQGVGFQLQPHLKRLQYSLDAVGIKTDTDWSSVLTELVQRNGGGNVSVYLQITRGSADKRTAAIDPQLQPTCFACCSPIRDIYSGGADTIAGIAALVVPDLRWQRCDIKANGLLPNILALQQAHAAGCQEAIQQRDHLITEGGSSNIFIVEQGRLLTPKLEAGILSGTTRDLVLKLADDAGIAAEEADITYEQLLAADEVWISSSTRAVVPVLKVDGQTIANGEKGPLWRRMFEMFATFQQRLMSGEPR